MGYMHLVRRLAMLAVAAAWVLLAAPGGTYATEEPIAPGTVITLQNWQQYSQFMPAGMQALFAGTYFWKLPPDFKMIVGPTSFYPLPEAYLEHTKQYSGQVQIKDLPDGEHTVTGYVAGRPFPNPADPMKGYKILVNTWFRYSASILRQRRPSVPEGSIRKCAQLPVRDSYPAPQPYQRQGSADRRPAGAGNTLYRVQYGA